MEWHPMGMVHWREWRQIEVVWMGGSGVMWPWWILGSYTGIPWSSWGKGCRLSSWIWGCRPCIPWWLWLGCEIAMVNLKPCSWWSHCMSGKAEGCYGASNFAARDGRSESKVVAQGEHFESKAFAEARLFHREALLPHSPGKCEEV